MTPQKIHVRSSLLLFFIRRMALLLAGIFSLLGAEPAQAAPLSCSAVYGMNTTGTIYEISAAGTSTVAASVPHPSSGQEQANPFGIGVGGNVVYVATRSGIVTSYNMNTGASTVSAPPTYPSGGVMDNIPAGAVNPKNGWFYLARAITNGGDATAWHLYAFNPATPAAAPIHIGLISGTIANNGDIVFDDDGNLYLLSSNIGSAPYTSINTRIYRVGQIPTSYSAAGFPATLLTQFIATDNFSGLAFNTAGELIASSGTGLLRRYNPISGQLIGSITTTINPLADMASCHGGNSIRLYKDLPDGRANASDQFRLTISGGPFSSAQSVNTTGAAVGVQSAFLGPFPLVDGASVTINETALGATDLSAYARSWRCADNAAAGQIVASGSSLPATVAIPTNSLSVGSDISCFIVNEMDGPPPEIGGAPVCTASGGADVLFLLDNSSSIDSSEYANFAAAVVNVGGMLLTANPASRIAVAHYSGTTAPPLASFGQHIYFERDFSSATVASPLRRFGDGGAYNSSYLTDNLAGAVRQMSYGLDLQAGTTSSFIVSPLTELNRNLTRPLQIVVFTDAFRDWSESAIIDGPGYGSLTKDGTDFTIYNQLKAQGVKFSVVAFTTSSLAYDIPRNAAAAAIASIGGAWMGSKDPNSQDPEGSGTPRRLVTTNNFTLYPAEILDLVMPVANVCLPPTDYGDAPASYGAPSHVIAAGPYLGASPPDAEAAPQHSADALGDNQNGIDDEDGISVFPPLYAGALSYSIPAANISATGTGTLHAWIDFDRNGVFWAYEHASVTVTDGVLSGPLNWTGIAIGSPGDVFLRLRFTSSTLTDDDITSLDYTFIDERSIAPAADGEVEDYAVTVAAPMLPPDAGMAVCTQPDAVIRTNLPLLGWHHNAPPGTLSSDSGDTPEISSAADLVPGAGLIYAPTYSGGSAYLVAGADEDGAAQAYAAQDYVGYSFTTSASLEPGVYLHSLRLHMPEDYAAYRPFSATILFSSDADFSSASIIADGWRRESPSAGRTLVARPVLLAPSTTYHVRAVIHDVDSSSGQAFWDDFSILFGSCADRPDAPASYGEARHAGGDAMRLGALRSVDHIDIASPDAMGDGATDDGVFLGDAAGGVSLQGATFVQGEPQTLEFIVAGAGRLSGWIDANRDGVFSSGVETLFLNLVDNGPRDENPAPGVIRITIAPPVLVEGVSFARFRWSSAPRLGPVGPAADGEVEDYALLLVAQSEAGFLLTPDHESVVEAGQLAIYPHRLLVGPGLNGGALSFAVESERGLEWSLLRDDGDGVYGARDLPWIQSAPIPAGDHAFWLLVKTPQEAPGGWSDLTRLTATILSGATTKNALAHDLTRIGGDGSGSVFARKLQALDVDCDGAPDGGETSFSEQTISIAPGDCAIYRILFENRSVDPIHQVRVQDHTPSWTVYRGVIAPIVSSPAGLTPLPPTLPAADQEGAILFPFAGVFNPGERGLVEFGIRLRGLPEPTTTPPEVKPN